MTERYWVGKRQGSQFRWLFDKDMPHEDIEMVYLFNADTLSMKEYAKAFAREVLATVLEDDRTAVISIYEKWHLENGATFLKKDEARRRRAMQVRVQELKARRMWEIKYLEMRRQSAIEHHKAYFEKHRKEYPGVSDSVRSCRMTHCYACSSPLDGELDLECRGCSWLVCFCGACGCGRESHEEQAAAT